jgi:hypothetical protein
MSAAARNRMIVVGDRFAAAGFPNPYTWMFDDVADVAGEPLALGLIARAEDGRPAYHLTEEGRSWVLAQRGLVVAFCPKCSTDEYLHRRDAGAQATCHVCGVRWTENTTAEPFIPRY